MTNSGLPSLRPIAAASRSCSSDSFGSLASVDVSCLLTTPMSSAVRPSARERAGQGRLASAEAGRQSADAGRRDRRVHAVGERGRVGDDAEDGQAHAGRDVAAGEQQRAAALGLHEPAASAVVGPADPALVDALGEHGPGVGGGRHVGEADDALGAEVVEATGHHELGLAEADLVDALLDRDGRGGARGDRVDHRAVAADVRLHDVRGDDVRQRLLQDVVRVVLAQQRVDVQRRAWSSCRPCRCPGCWPRGPGAPSASARRA